MIELITIVLQLLKPLVEFFVGNQETKVKMKEKMLALMERYRADMAQNGRARSEYDKLRAEIDADKAKFP